MEIATFIIVMAQKTMQKSFAERTGNLKWLISKVICCASVF